MDPNLKIEFIRKYLENSIHDMRTYVSVIISNMQLLSEYSALADYESKRINDVMGNCGKLMNMLVALEDYDRIFKDSVTPSYMNLDAVAMMDSLVDSVMAVAFRKRVSIIFDTDLDEKVIGTDRLWFERIILNIISNAIKFSGSGGRIGVNLKDEGEFIKITVSDEGTGVESSMLPNVFDRYETSAGQDGDSPRGHGIGLAIVKEMVDVLGGQIEIHNQVLGTGAVVTLRLPAQMAEEEYDMDEAAPGAEQLELFYGE